MIRDLESKPVGIQNRVVNVSSSWNLLAQVDMKALTMILQTFNNLATLPLESLKIIGGRTQSFT